MQITFEKWGGQFFEKPSPARKNGGLVLKFLHPSPARKNGGLLSTFLTPFSRIFYPLLRPKKNGGLIDKFLHTSPAKSGGARPHQYKSRGGPGPTGPTAICTHAQKHRCKSLLKSGGASFLQSLLRPEKTGGYIKNFYPLLRPEKTGGYI